MKIYRGTDGDVEPVEMECDEFGYPNRTIDDELMYENTHFKTEKEAWVSILNSVKAGVNLTGRDVASAEKNILRAQRGAADSAKAFSIAHKKYRLWESHNKSLHLTAKSSGK